MTLMRLFVNKQIFKNLLGDGLYRSLIPVRCSTSDKVLGLPVQLEALVYLHDVIPD